MKAVIIIFIFITTLFSNENPEKISLQLKEKEQSQFSGFHVSLTEEEKQYIKDKKTINVCIKSNQEPLVIKDKKGYSGISIDYLDLVFKSTNMKFNYVYNHTMKDYLNGVKNGKCDMLSLVLTKQNQYNFLTPSIVSGIDTVVIATAIDTPYLSDLNDLNNEKIMVQKNAKNFIKYIRYFYPNLNLVEVSKIDLQRVVSGEFYGAVGGSYLLAYQIQSEYPYSLKIMTKIGEKIEGSFGVSNRESLLLSILNKSFTHISESAKQKIMHSYKSIKVEKQIDYIFVLQIVAISLLIIVFLIWLYLREKKLNQIIKQDIKDKKYLEDKLIVANKSLENRIKAEVEKSKQHQITMIQQSRLAQMGEMISMIAHQWRQPLNNLSMIIQSAALKHKLGRFDDERMVKLSEDSQKQIMQMSQTIDDFRYFFKPNKHPSEFNVTTSILHVLTLLKPSLEQELIVVETHLEDDVLMKGFSNELGQVLLNILNNARDVLVENNRDKKKIISIVLKKEDENVLITIEDNAGGIEDDVIDKIFDPYFSTKEGRNGTGLGLYMSKSIIEGQCQGHLSVKNGTNGAIFKIVLGGGN